MRFACNYGVLRRFHKYAVLINPELVAADREEGYYQSFFDSTAIAARSSTRQMSGRGQTYIYEHEGLRLVLREYRRGGLFGRCISRSYISLFRGSYRSILEFELLRRLRQCGLHVPQPVLARVRVCHPVVRNEIVLQEISDSRNLDEILAERPLRDAELLHISEQLAALFSLGVVHSDLNIRNLLLDKRQEAYIIDFDKCFIKQDLTDSDRLRMLQRLERSLFKQQRRRARSGQAFHCDARLIDVIRAQPAVRQAADNQHQ